MRLVIPYPLLALLAACAGLFLAAASLAEDLKPAKAPAELIAGWQASLDRAEISISQGRSQDPEQIEKTKQALNQVLIEAQALQSRGQQRLGPLKAELASLGPVPEDTAPPEDAKVAETRGRLQQELSAIQGQLSQAQLAMVRAQNLLGDIGRIEQGRLTAYMMSHGPTPLKPEVWIAAGKESVTALETLLVEPGAWWARVVDRDLDETAAVAGISLLLFSVLLAWPLRRWIIRRWGAVADETEPSYARRIVVAGTTGLAEVLLPSIALAALLGVAELTAPSQDDFFVTMVQGTGISLILFFVVVGLSDAALSPRLPAWRIIPATTLGARRLATKTALLAGLIGVTNIAYFAASKDAGPSAEFVSVLMFLRNVALCAVFLSMLRRRYWLEPGTQPKSGFWPCVRLLLGAVMLATPCLSLAGYAALSSFIVATLVLSIAIVGAALLLRAVLHEGLVQLMRPARGGSSAAPPHRLTFWVNVLIDITLWPPVVYLLLLSLGLSPALLNVWIGTALTGIRIGEVTLSLFDVATALFITVFGLLLVGWGKRWLGERVMPNTRFDIGLQNSLTAGFSYVGAIIVIMLAILALGIDLSSLAIVAGALSVGIGFGLKTVVENFVAGVLLLIERPIKVGDWIVVGGNEGVVKRISVRSTEVETFDHATVIVPNSDLIGQSVVNWTHKNRMVRVIISVGVAYGSDTRQVRDILIGCAEKHPHVVADPAPAVVFRSFGDSSLAFELRTFVDDADYVGEVRNDLNFAIDDAFRAHKIEIPFPQRDLHIRTAPEAAVVADLTAAGSGKAGGLQASRDDYA